MNGNETKLSNSIQFNQNWQSVIQSSAKLLNYRLFKEQLIFENHLDTLTKKSNNIL